MTGWFRLLFLFSSFGPLYLIFAAKLYFNDGVSPIFPVVFFGMAALSVCVFLFLRLQMQAANGQWFEVMDVKQKDSEIFSYLTTYIPPLITRDMSDPEVYVPLLILYSVIAVLYFRLDSPYLNPFFAIFKYRIYEGRIRASRGMVTIISHKRPLAGTDEVMLREIGNGDLYYCESA